MSELDFHVLLILFILFKFFFELMNDELILFLFQIRYGFFGSHFLEFMNSFLKLYNLLFGIVDTGLKEKACFFNLVESDFLQIVESLKGCNDRVCWGLVFGWRDRNILEETVGVVFLVGLVHWECIGDKRAKIDRFGFYLILSVC